MKIILAINEAELNMGAVDFACYLANLTKSKLTGILLENNEKMETNMSDKNENSGSRPSNLFPGEVISLRETGFRFQEACTVRETICNIHRDDGVPFQEIIKESRFADVLIINSTLSFPVDVAESPSKFVKRILAETECPVIIAPKDDRVINQALFTYDNSRNSVFALKQFTYLFPQFKEILIVEAEKGEPSDDREKLTEWLKDHYYVTRSHTVTGNAENRLLETSLSSENCMVIMGGDGKGLSSLFSKSPETNLIRLLSQPIFIARN